MKNVALYAVLLIVGILIGKFLLDFDSTPPPPNNSSFTKSELDTTEAQNKIKNYNDIVKKSAPSALLFDNSLISELLNICNEEGRNGVRIYFTASKTTSPSPNDFDGFVAASTVDGNDSLITGTPNVYFFKLDNSPSGTGLCPPTCDVKSPLYIKIPLKLEEHVPPSEPVDSSSADTE